MLFLEVLPKRRLPRTGFTGLRKGSPAARLAWANLAVPPWSLPVLSEITSNSLFWVKLFGELAPKSDRKPGREE